MLATPTRPGAYQHNNLQQRELNILAGKEVLSEKEPVSEWAEEGRW